LLVTKFLSLIIVRFITQWTFIHFTLTLYFLHESLFLSLYHTRILCNYRWHCVEQYSKLASTFYRETISSPTAKIIVTLTRPVSARSQISSAHQNGDTLRSLNHASRLLSPISYVITVPYQLQRHGTPTHRMAPKLPSSTRELLLESFTI
jgi:hypothetical protein